VAAKYKVSVDPVEHIAIFKIESDRFFALNQECFDIIFIDGKHTKEQVLRDFDNALKWLGLDGSIVVHDCNPVKERDTDTAVNGTVWEAWARYRMCRPDLSMAVLDTDHGCGVIRRGQQELFPLVEGVDYNFLDRNREKLLNLVPPVWPNWLDNNFK
jgi:hypothetical protein